MIVETLHTTHGDDVKDHDTSSPECRIEVKKFIEGQLKNGQAMFLERTDKKGKTKTYRITGYDAKTDSLLTRVEKKKKEQVKADSKKGRVTSVPPRAGG